MNYLIKVNLNNINYIQCIKNLLINKIIIVQNIQEIIRRGFFDGNCVFLFRRSKKKSATGISVSDGNGIFDGDSRPAKNNRRELKTVDG